MGGKHHPRFLAGHRNDSVKGIGWWLQPRTPGRGHHPVPLLRPFDSAQGERNPTHGFRLGRGVVWLWGLGFHVVLAVGFWVGDGRSGTLVQDDYDTYADAGSIGGVLPYPHSCHWGLAGVEGVPGWGIPSCISARPLRRTAFGSNRHGRNGIRR